MKAIADAIRRLADVVNIDDYRAERRARQEYDSLKKRLALYKRENCTYSIQMAYEPGTAPAECLVEALDQALDKQRFHQRLNQQDKQALLLAEEIGHKLLASLQHDLHELEHFSHSHPTHEQSGRDAFMLQHSTIPTLKAALHRMDS